MNPSFTKGLLLGSMIGFIAGLLAVSIAITGCTPILTPHPFTDSLPADTTCFPPTCYQDPRPPMKQHGR